MKVKKLAMISIICMALFNSACGKEGSKLDNNGKSTVSIRLPERLITCDAEKYAGLIGEYESGKFCKCQTNGICEILN